jgi:hypothetical protein
MPDRERKISLDVLIEGPGGDLVFREIRASRNDIAELVGASRNPVVKNNVFLAGAQKKVKL